MGVLSGNPTIGILYPGELGASLGRLLVEGGMTVVVALEGRSSNTRRLSRSAGLSELATVEELISSADLIISVVVPSAAVHVAELFASTVSATGAGPKIYADINSISPQTAEGIAQIVGAVGVRFCDCAIHGLARPLEQGTLFTSGEAGQDVAAVLAETMTVRFLGEQAGAASFMKMLLGGFSKSMCASFFHLAVLAEDGSLFDEFLNTCQRYYPGVITVLERLLPTYPRHAGRRAEEMAELADTLRRAGMQSWHADAAQQTFAALVSCGSKEGWHDNEGSPAQLNDLQRVRKLISFLHELHPFNVTQAVALNALTTASPVE